jgi:hypothetical protein
MNLAWSKIMIMDSQLISTLEAQEKEIDYLYGQLLKQKHLLDAARYELIKCDPENELITEIWEVL